MSESELAEIAHLLPVLKSIAPAPAETPAPTLILEAVPEGPMKSGYAHFIIPGCEYEGLYAATSRTMKRWKQVGELAVPPALPPLDSPWLMATWWRKNMTRVVPERLVELEEKGPPSVNPRANSNSTPAPHTSNSSPCAQPNTTSATVKTGYAAVLARFQEAEAVAFERYIEAFKSPDLTIRETAASLKRDWNDLAQTMRNYERDAAKILSASGNLWDAPQVIETITTLHTTIFAGIRRLHRRMRQLNPDAHLLPVAKQDALWDAQVDALATALANSAFTSAALPEPAAPAVDQVNAAPLPESPQEPVAAAA